MQSDWKFWQHMSGYYSKIISNWNTAEERIELLLTLSILSIVMYYISGNTGFNLLLCTHRPLLKMSMCVVRLWMIQLWKLLSYLQLQADIPTSIPSRFMMVASILRIAVLIERGGGNFVIPILMAFERLWSNTMISLFLFISCCFWLQQNAID